MGKGHGPTAGRTDDRDTIEDVFVRAARELLRWDQARLAEAADVSVSAVRRFELGGKAPAGTGDKILAALREAGVDFLPARSRRGADVLGGVELRKDNRMGRRNRYGGAKADGAGLRNEARDEDGSAQGPDPPPGAMKP